MIYRHKSRQQLAVDASKRRIRNEAKILLDEILNEVMYIYAEEVAATPDAIMEITDLSALRRYVRDAAINLDIFQDANESLRAS